MNKIIIEKDSNDVNLEISANTEVTYIALKPNLKREFTIHEDATLTLYYINFSQIKNQLDVKLVGKNANFIGNTLTIGQNDNYDYIQNIMHLAKNTKSNIVNLAISLGNSDINFTTTSHILNKMTKSECRQLAKGIIISKDSSISAKPILLIDENDVFAYHGAAIGKMSDDSLFYLMSRGLTQEEALKLIIGGMINPFVAALPSDLQKDINIEIEKRIKL